MSSLLRTMRRRIERVGHYGRGGRAHLQAQDWEDLIDFQRQVNTRLKHIQPVKPQIIDNTSALKHRREPRVVIECTIPTS